jgi:ATP:corrinoid adenosyltransferase
MNKGLSKEEGEVSWLLLILGNGHAKRLVAYALAARVKRDNKAIEWFNFACENAKKTASRSLEHDILSLQNTNYTVFHLSDAGIYSDASSYDKSKRLKKQETAFHNWWGNINSIAAEKEVEIIFLENIDAALDTGWLKVSDITNILAKAKSKQVVIIGVHLPIDILALADKIVEVWERENNNKLDL